MGIKDLKTEKFENVTILLPAMDETYSLRETVETLLKTCHKRDLAEIISMNVPPGIRSQAMWGELGLLSLFGAASATRR